MFSFQDGLATNLTFRLTPGAGMIFRDDEYDSMAPEVSMVSVFTVLLSTNQY